jgi:hypothetical protein
MLRRVVDVGDGVGDWAAVGAPLVGDHREVAAVQVGLDRAGGSIKVVSDSWVIGRSVPVKSAVDRARGVGSPRRLREVDAQQPHPVDDPLLTAGEVAASMRVTQS